MARRGHKLDAEAGEVEDDRVQDVHLDLASVAPSGADLPELQRAPEQAERVPVEGPRQPHGLAVDHEVLFGPGRHPVVARESDSSRGTGLLALAAEETPTEVECEPPAVETQSARRAGLDAG